MMLLSLQGFLIAVTLEEMPSRSPKTTNPVPHRTATQCEGDEKSHNSLQGKHSPSQCMQLTHVVLCNPTAPAGCQMFYFQTFSLSRRRFASRSESSSHSHQTGTHTRSSAPFVKAFEMQAAGSSQNWKHIRF